MHTLRIYKGDSTGACKYELFTTQHEDKEHLRRIANEWYSGRNFCKAVRGRRATKPLSLARLSKMHDPDGYLRCLAEPVMTEVSDNICTDDPCGGHLIYIAIS